MSSKKCLGPVPHVSHIFSHLIFKSNQPIKVHVVIFILYKRTLDIRNLKQHNDKWQSHESNQGLRD